MIRNRRLASMMSGATKDERDFFRMMDCYDAFYDEYTACIRRYESHPEDAEAAAELYSMMNRETAMFKAMRRLDPDSMTRAQHTYYAMVISSIDQKLMSAVS